MNKTIDEGLLAMNIMQDIAARNAKLREALTNASICNFASCSSPCSIVFDGKPLDTETFIKHAAPGHEEHNDENIKYLLVSPLGPLTASLFKEQKPADKTTTANITMPVMDCLALGDLLSGVTMSSCVKTPKTLQVTEPRAGPENTVIVFEHHPIEDRSYYRIKSIKNIKSFDDLPDIYKYGKNASSCSKSQTTQITFQHEPAEAEERFRIVKVENVIANRDLPMLYIYGSPAAYYTRPFVTGGQNGTYLFVRYKEDSRKYIIGMSNVDKTELAWIIKTMKMAGSALINIRKQVAKTQAKKGKTFTVSI